MPIKLQHCKDLQNKNVFGIFMCFSSNRKQKKIFQTIPHRICGTLLMFWHSFHSPEVIWSYKHGQNIWNKVKKSSKIGQEQKTSFLIAHTKILVLKGELALSSTKFDLFLLFPNFLRP